MKATEMEPFQSFSEQELQDLNRSEPGNTDALIALANRLTRAKRLKEAVKPLRRLALALPKQDLRYGRIMELLVRCYLEIGEPWRACQLAQKTLEHPVHAIKTDDWQRMIIWELVSKCCGILAKRHIGRLNENFMRLEQEAQRQAHQLRLHVAVAAKPLRKTTGSFSPPPKRKLETS